MPWNQYSGSIAFKPPNKKAFLESQVKNVKQTVMVLMILVNTVVVLQNGMTTSPSESFGYLSDFLCHLPSESVFTVTHLLQLCCCILFWHLTVHLQRITESVITQTFSCFNAELIVSSHIFRCYLKLFSLYGFSIIIK